MIKKIFIFIFTLCLIFIFSISSFAMSIPGDVQNITNNLNAGRRLLTPDRLTYLRTDSSGVYSSVNGGVIFEVSPRYAIDPSYLPQTTYVNNSGVNINDDIPSWMRYLYHSLSYEQSFNTYSQSMYISKKSSVTTTDIFYCQVDFSDFTIPLESPDGMRSTFMFTHIPSGSNFTYSYVVKYAIKQGNNVLLKDFTFQVSNDGSSELGFTFAGIRDRILDDVETKGYNLHLVNGDIYIDTLSFSGYSSDGYIRIIQAFDEGITANPANIFPYVDEVPDFLSSLISNVSNFFSTTLFQIGGVNISFGVVFAIPFVISILFIFLRKFAGG